MPTNVIILGQEEQKEKKKPIEFVRGILSDGRLTAPHSPREWTHIELVCKGYKRGKYDLMFAYDDDRNLGCLYLGHFNDGVVD